jgi:hypothetical protein
MCEIFNAHCCAIWQSSYQTRNFALTSFKVLDYIFTLFFEGHGV